MFRSALVTMSAAVTLGLAALVPAVNAGAVTTATPAVTALSIHRDATWGGRRVTITGRNFTDVRQVLFGSNSARVVSWPSSGSLVVETPEAAVGVVHVRVRTGAGLSAATTADRFSYTKPTMDDPINGGWTAHQEQGISAYYAARASAYEGISIAPRSSSWTPAMGVTAARRARAWVGMPYSWAAGTTRSPSNGVCSSADGGGGEFDCHIWGFDCSGLSLYGWGPYLNMPHFAASQYNAGAYHPGGAQLAPGDLLFYGAGTIGHVVIYIGRGQIVQAWQSGHPIQVSKVSDMTWMAGQYRGATRPLTKGARPTAVAVTGLSADTGSTAGGLVTITGRGFSGATSVVVGSTVIYDFQVLSSTKLTVRVPAHVPWTTHIRVADAWGISTMSAADAWTWVGAPAVTDPTPLSGSSVGGDTVSFTGTNFRDVTSVTFGGVRATSVRTVSSTRLNVVTPPHAVGAVPMVVTTRYGTSAAKPFTYIAPPKAATISPASGSSSGGDSVTITGSSFSGAGFSGPVSVLFGSVPATSVQVSSATTLTVVVPPGVVGAVPVTVTTRYGTTSPALTFTYTAPPGS